ncbi:uncharacterized protein LOC131432453 [Malaya genurostris]|uniref:uncharacterized protein LOC131432453 n=1 Tax=Malaya genurostris TaxID=325434 RepID=UPI0026F3C49F|nr:uncharacterized protein LOC131432453 [Malaya genurostris]
MSITTSQLNNSLSACGYSGVGENLGSTIVNQINRSVSDRNEAAMFIAHLIHESGGFEHREEKSRGAGEPYPPYYGRGYIQLTWADNYRAASKDLYGDESVLLNDPDQVSRTPKDSMDVSTWYWKNRVRPEAAPFNNFYRTTKAINGGLEGSSSHPAAKTRYGYYRKVAQQLGIHNLAREG